MEEEGAPVFALRDYAVVYAMLREGAAQALRGRKSRPRCSGRRLRGSGFCSLSRQRSLSPAKREFELHIRAISYLTFPPLRVLPVKSLIFCLRMGRMGWSRSCFALMGTVGQAGKSPGKQPDFLARNGRPLTSDFRPLCEFRNYLQSHTNGSLSTFFIARLPVILLQTDTGGW